MLGENGRKGNKCTVRVGQGRLTMVKECLFFSHPDCAIIYTSDVYGTRWGDKRKTIIKRTRTEKRKKTVDGRSAESTRHGIDRRRRERR